VNNFVRRVYNTILHAFSSVDGGGNYISKDIKTSLDAYTKSAHNPFGMVTGALPNGKKAGVALTDGSISAMRAPMSTVQQHLCCPEQKVLMPLRIAQRT